MKKIIIFCLIIFTYSAQINAKDFSGVYVGLWCELSPKCKDKIEKNLMQPVHSIFSERRNKTFIYIDQIEKDNFKILISDPFFEIENIVFQENRFVGQIRVTGRGKYKIEGGPEVRNYVTNIKGEETTENRSTFSITPTDTFVDIISKEMIVDMFKAGTGSILKEDDIELIYYSKNYYCEYRCTCP